jgi:hypothetical protein
MNLPGGGRGKADKGRAHRGRINGGVKTKRRQRRMSAAPSMKKSGETFVRVFECTPIGLVIQHDHSVEEVIKSYQGDLAGVEVGDTIVEINYKRVDPTLSGIAVSVLVVQSQRERGRVRIRFWRPLSEQVRDFFCRYF